jgi:DNA-binding transcriptional MerR regulator/predicted transcriptional regulator YdeE
MYTIGEFASIGRVSVRMLRHYDQIGLLVPERVDPVTGYRSYGAGQVVRLARALALKDLGLRLDEVTRIMRGDVDDDALHGLLTARRADLASRLDLDRARLGRLDARIRVIEGGESMSVITVETKALTPVRVASATAVAAGPGPENIGPVIGPLFARLGDDLDDAGVERTGAALSYYDFAPDGLRVTAAFEVGAQVESGSGFVVEEVPGVELAATTVHYGSMATVGEAWSALHQWIGENGYQLDGAARELSIVAVPEPQENWVTELQQPVTRG